MKWIDDDGGRKRAGYKGKARDCFCRAVAIATQLPYRQVYAAINDRAKLERKSKRSSARAGVTTKTARAVMADLGWQWVPTMGIGTGSRVKLRDLPHKRIVVRLSRHYTAMVEGVIHDDHDPSRNGTRCVYGYWKAD